LPRRLLIVAAAALIPVLAGCAAGDNAPTLNWHYPTDGAGTVVQGISIRNVFVLGGPQNSVLTAGQSAGLYFALVNTGSPDRLLSVQAPGTATSVTIPNGSIKLATNQAVFLTGPAPQAILNGLTNTLSGGAVITLILNFQNAGSVTLRVPVLARAQAYATFSAAPTPTPTVTPGSRKHHKGATASPGTSTTPTTSPSPSTSSTS
jgi:copper(I)-binding protein